MKNNTISHPESPRSDARMYINATPQRVAQTFIQHHAQHFKAFKVVLETKNITVQKIMQQYNELSMEPESTSLVTGWKKFSSSAFCLWKLVQVCIILRCSYKEKSTYLQQNTESIVSQQLVESPEFTSTCEIIHIYSIYTTEKDSASFKMYIHIFFSFLDEQKCRGIMCIIKSWPRGSAANALKPLVYWKSSGSNSITVFNLWSSSNLI